MLLDAVVDVTEAGSGQHIGGLLVDQRVEVSLDLENVAEGCILKPLLPERATRHLWLMENWPLPLIMELDNGRAAALGRLTYKGLKNSGIRGAFGREQYVTRHLSARTQANSLAQKIYALWVKEKGTD